MNKWGQEDQYLSDEPEKPYDRLAQVYDYLMTGTDYYGWAGYIQRILEEHGCPGKRVLDLACGTGSSTLALGEKGYEVTGLDLSPQMLGVAREKAREKKREIPFIQQDMRQLALPHKVDLVVVFQDGLNYILEEDELVMVFCRVLENLNPGGLFVFDINSVDKLPTVGGEVTCYEEEGMTLIWESSLDRDTGIWEITLTGFLRGRDNLYEKFKETHRERYYPGRVINRCLARAGLDRRAVYRAFTLEEGRDTDQRVYYVARKPGGGNNP